MATSSRPAGVPIKRTSEHPSANVSPVGTPDLRALRAAYVGTPPLVPNIPPRGAGTSSPIPGPHHGVQQFQPSRDVSPPHSPHPRRHVHHDVPDPTHLDIDDLPDEEKVRALRKYLVAKSERRDPNTPTSLGVQSPGSRNGASSPSSVRHVEREETEPFPVPYHAPGADVTHDIYKWQSEQRKHAARARANSFSGGTPTPQDPAFEHIHEPGGFRRNYVLLHANESGPGVAPPILNNFIDFLFLFGHFAGEDLEEDEEDEEDEGVVQPEPSARRGVSLETDERLPLLERRSRSRRRRNSIAENGEATVTQAVLMLLKAFIGTGVLFLGKAFFNGGLLFSSLCICFVALISLYSFLLLVKTKFAVPGSYGDIGGHLFGEPMRLAILSSITISQLGFVAAYTIFVSQNLQTFVAAATHCATNLPPQVFLLVQLVVFLPLALVRNLERLSLTALVADAFIVLGLLYIFTSEGSIIAQKGIAEIKMFNPDGWPLFIGTAVFSFEGIGLVLPIVDSMRQPHRFPAVLTGVMIFLMFLFGGAGALSYLTFGKDVQSVVITNLDTSSKMVQAVQLIYSLAILLSVPLQLFPAVRIMEHGLFGTSGSGKRDPRIKWLKNLFRCAVVMFCTAVSWAGAADLDKFVALVGSFACVPLCYIYPPMLHYKACAKTMKEKVADILLIVFGVFATIYTTFQTIRLMALPDNGGDPKCAVPPHL